MNHQPLHNAPLLRTRITACSSLAYRSVPWELPPSTSPQGALGYLMNNTTELRAQDQPFLRSETLDLHLNVGANLPYIPVSVRYTGGTASCRGCDAEGMARRCRGLQGCWPTPGSSAYWRWQLGSPLSTKGSECEGSGGVQVAERPEKEAKLERPLILAFASIGSE